MADTRQVWMVACSACGKTMPVEQSYAVAFGVVLCPVCRARSRAMADAEQGAADSNGHALRAAGHLDG